MKTLSVLQSNYIPWKGYFDIIRCSDIFVLLDEVQYTKNDWRNRNKIKTAAGEQWITIPIESHFHDHPRICDVEVPEPRWTTKHLRSIQQSYAKSSHLHLYSDALEDLYKECASIKSLSQINEIFLSALCSILDISTPFERAENILGKGRVEAMDRNMRLIEICKEVNADTYISGRAAETYIDLDLFLQNGIQVIWADYSRYKPYKQLHGDFVHGVSAIDLILNEGPNAKNFLTDITGN